LVAVLVGASASGAAATVDDWEVSVILRTLGPACYHRMSPPFQV
jgi:hypothetical protein